MLAQQTSFKAGRLQDFLVQWEVLTSDPIILRYVTGVKIEFKSNIMPQQHYRRPSMFNVKESAIVQSEIDKLITKGVIVPSSPEMGDFVSTIFLRPKKDGTYRTILNLKQFNEYVEYHHFKMDTLEAAINMIKPGCYMASVDLKDAYYTVPIDPSHQKFLKFWWDGKFFQYTCLPNGLASAPRIFTKLLKPVYSALRSAGHLSSGYIDDSYLQGDTFEECHKNVIDTATMFTKLGFFVHPDKSIFVPSQRLTFLGFVLDSIHMTVQPTEDKIVKTLASCNSLLQIDTPTIRQVAEVIGILVSNFPGAQYGPLHYRHLERDKYHALVDNKGDYTGIMQLSQSALTEIQWWINNAKRLTRNICHDNPSVNIQSDASKLGWGAVYGEKKTGGRWTPSEAQCHINLLELRAAFFALKCFCKDMKDIHVQLQIDNTTAVAYINNMGGSKSTELNQLAFSVWDWCITRNVWLSAVHIAGTLNTGADEKSRKFSDSHEWKLDELEFGKIVSRHPNLNIDMFATRLNNQLSKYCAWKADPGSTYTDAFSVNWNNHNFYAFPPFSLLPRCLQKIQQDNAKGVLIAPLWPTQPWFPLLLQFLEDRPWVIPPRSNLLQHPSRDQPHPLHKKLYLMVCPVSGNTSDVCRFQQTLPKYSWHPGDKEQRSNMPRTSKNGWHFAVRDRWITLTRL